ncbi:MAG: undecaprenyl-diphosphate phosphatase [Propionibacteriaceae bacterium]|jgi:undecaprenyl-diphosphatase|nr:undecaprenyl-diphosphate phosphatase [Propionibacteriaceae bacterium]
MDWLAAIILGVVEGITEFLPVSSTGHLTVVEKLLGLTVDDPDVTAFTAIVQVGAIAAAIVYFRRDIVRLATAWCAGLVNAERRRTTDYRLGWAVIVGSIPIGVVGLAFESVIEGVLRSLWVVAGALIAWSAVMWLADRHAARRAGPAAGGLVAAASPAGGGAAALAGRGTVPAGLRGEDSLTVVDGLVIGLGQCLALVPGVSRSGATISVALFRGIDRTTATRWSFFLGIPALTASGVLQAVKAADDIAVGVGWAPTAVATAVSFAVAYASIAWLLRFVASNRFTGFVVYRVLAGLAVASLLAFGVVAAV